MTLDPHTNTGRLTMGHPLTPAPAPPTEPELAAIRDRHENMMGYYAQTTGSPSQIAQDRGRLLLEVDRLNRAVQLLGSQLQGGAQSVVDALSEAARRLPPEDVETFIKRKRDEWEPRGDNWNVADDILDDLRLYLVTGTRLTDPRPSEFGWVTNEGRPPLTEAEELHLEVRRLKEEIATLRASVAITGRGCACSEHGQCPACCGLMVAVNASKS
ncbi:hypothetical protein ACOZ38_25475 [Sphaerisporangium viridialbum]|uniref:hypothetical protein n=1 Tax=Sphaerisporangium viridialbum TaxID=46189 RepID=UPI003C71352F